MASNYDSIRGENLRRYGTDVGRYGPMLLADRYDDRTHFIYELLQNAEDALARRSGWGGSRTVTFTLSAKALRIAHFGQPFNERDVRGICGIAESTKDLTAIGRFGIGFKSVYAFTARPEVHSGEEDFAIESFVWPVANSAIYRHPDETVFVLPLREEDTSAHADILKGLYGLGSRSLLFLRQIEEIQWEVEAGPSGIYRRDSAEKLGENVRRISLIGQKKAEPAVEETWLVFSQEARTQEDKFVGHVEIAFLISQDSESRRWSIQAINDSSLVVFFPTILPTYLGFLVQGPYRTTPSRDNVPRNDPWNQKLVRKTAALLVEVLRWLRDHGLLDAGTLRCLPLNRAKFAVGSMFEPLFEAVRDALASEALLPRFSGGHIAAREAKLARTQELRELFDPNQLGRLFGVDGAICWLSEDITQDRAPELRQYLMQELDIAEIAPDTIVPKLSTLFLEAQSDDWIVKLYDFLYGQPALLRQGRLDHVPLIRLKDGKHRTAKANNQPQVFLPSAIETDFLSVRPEVCASDEPRRFLQSLGLTEPDSVDDVIWNVLPKYRRDKLDPKDHKTDIRPILTLRTSKKPIPAAPPRDYESDFRRILTAFRTDSEAQREKLIKGLREAYFVVVEDAGNGAKHMSGPSDVYLCTERLKELFAGVGGVYFASESHPCLRGEEARKLLLDSGVSRHLKPERINPPWEKLQKLRELAGTTNTRSQEEIEDYSLRGLESLLQALPALDADDRRTKAKILWEALSDLEQRQRSAFTGKYQGQYYGRKYGCEFEVDFVERLNNTPWVTEPNGKLERPEFVVFDALGWKPNPFLLSKIRFKPSIIETLAKEAGIEPGLLDLLKKLGLTSEAELRVRLGIKESLETKGAVVPNAADDRLEKLPGKTTEPMPSIPVSANLSSDGAGGAGDSGNREGTGESGARHRGQRRWSHG
jgi:hypothetical protein